MEEYDQWASVYDAIYGEHTPDISFYVKEAKKAHGPVLELACGTGRILLPMLKAGIEAHGVDISGKMLGVLKRKASSLDLKPSVYLADMRTFKLKKKFSLIIVPFRSFLHLITIEDQLKTLKNIRSHLAPNGKLILNFFYPSPEVMVMNYGKERKLKGFKLNGRKTEYADRTDYEDEIDQIICFEKTLKRGGKLIFRSGPIRVAYIYKREFELLLRLSGYSKYKLYGGFNNELLQSQKQEMVWIVAK